jgi:ATP-dependent RNA helicase DeaD
MIRLSFDRGSTHGIRPGEVVSTIAFFAEIPGSSIGKINILEQQTLVDVPKALVNQVLSNAENYRIHRLPVKVEIA